MLNLRVYSIKCWPVNAGKNRICQPWQPYTMQFAQAKLNEKRPCRTCLWNFPYRINLADIPTKDGGQRGIFSCSFPSAPHLLCLWSFFPLFRCLFLSHEQVKTLKTQNSLGLVVENHQGQQENELRSDTHGLKVKPSPPTSQQCQ